MGSTSQSAHSACLNYVIRLVGPTPSIKLMLGALWLFPGHPTGTSVQEALGRILRKRLGDFRLYSRPLTNLRELGNKP